MRRACFEYINVFNNNTRMSPKRATPAREGPLPRGRHGLSRKVVRGSQRARLLHAMKELVAQHGYAATTVPQVVARARVSRNAFYEFFADKEACFLAMCEDQAAQFSATVRAVAALERGWMAALRAGIRASLDWYRERPEFSRAYFVELPTAGQAAIEQRLRAYLPFERMLVFIAEWARREHPALPPLRARLPHMAIVAITETIAGEVRAGRTQRLLELEDDLTYSTMNLLAGAEPGAAS